MRRLAGDTSDGVDMTPIQLVTNGTLRATLARVAPYRNLAGAKADHGGNTFGRLSAAIDVTQAGGARKWILTIW